MSHSHSEDDRVVVALPFLTGVRLYRYVEKNTGQSEFLFINLLITSFIYLSCLSVHLPIHLPVCLSIYCACTCLYVYVQVCVKGSNAQAQVNGKLVRVDGSQGSNLAYVAHWQALIHSTILPNLDH